MKKLSFLPLLLAVCCCSVGNAQDVMVKNHSQKEIRVQIALMRIPLGPNDSIKFKAIAENDYLLRVQFIGEKNDTCVFKKMVSSPGVVIITDRDLKRYKHFYCPEKNGEPIANRKTRF